MQHKTLFFATSYTFKYNITGVHHCRKMSTFICTFRYCQILLCRLVSVCESILFWRKYFPPISRSMQSMYLWSLPVAFWDGAPRKNNTGSNEMTVFIILPKIPAVLDSPRRYVNDLLSSHISSNTEPILRLYKTLKLSTEYWQISLISLIFHAKSAPASGEKYLQEHRISGMFLLVCQ